MSEEPDLHAELGEQGEKAVPDDEVKEVDEVHDEAVEEDHEEFLEAQADDEARHEEARAETAESNAPDEMPNDDR